MEYNGSKPIATPLCIATAANDQVRAAPTPTTTVPFASWPFATALEDVIARNPGNINAGVSNGNTTLQVYAYTVTTPSSPLYTNRVEIRVAFDANGNKARFTQNNRLLSNNGSTNFVTVLDTIYTIEDAGGVRLMKFAAMPAGFEDSYRFARLFAQRGGGVWYAYKDTVQAAPNWSIRLNKTADDALRQALGIQ